MQVRPVHMKPLSKDTVPVHTEIFSALWHGREGMRHEGHRSTFCSVSNPINRRDTSDSILVRFMCAHFLVLCLFYVMDVFFLFFFFLMLASLFFLNLYLPDMNRCQRKVLDLVYTLILPDPFDIWHS